MPGMWTRHRFAASTAILRWRPHWRGWMRRRMVDLWERLFPLLREADDLSPRGWSGCWIYTRKGDGHGYARMRAGRGLRVGVHRIAYELVIGTIPEGLVIDHLCGRGMC